MKISTNTLYVLLLLLVGSCNVADSNNSATEDTSTAQLSQIELENAKSILEAGDNLTKAYVYSSDSLFHLQADMQKDHRIFGYKKPDIKSKRLILFSIYTNDVDNNPYGLKLGAYYDLESSGLTVQYQEHDEDYVEAIVTDSLDNLTTIYFERDWIILVGRLATLDEELQEYGIIEDIEDGGYPISTVLVNFPKNETKIVFYLNIEAISLGLEDLSGLIGKYASIHYISEMDYNLMDIQVNGATLLGAYAPEFDDSWKQITGVLSGADSTTESDLPDIISVTDDSGQKIEFEMYIDQEIVNANGKIVDAYYYIRGRNTITHIVPE